MVRIIAAITFALTLVLLNSWSAEAAVRMPLDPSFGSNGVLITDVAGGAHEDEPFDLEVQPDGKLVLPGKVYSAASKSFDFALLRYHPDGQLDTGFDDDGVAITDFAGGHDEALGAAVQSDGKIVQVGVATKPATGRTDFGLVRRNADGTLDNTFGWGGRVMTDFQGGNDLAWRVAVQPDGKIVAAGTATTAATGNDFALVRYNPNGSIDTTFGAGGKTTTDFFGQADVITDLVQLPDGKFIAVGVAKNPFNSSTDFALARYNSDGTLDTTFATYGADGVAVVDFLQRDDIAYSVVVQPDGKIVIGGLAFNPATSSNDVALARFNADGSLDMSFATFGAPGVVTTDFARGYDQVLSLAIQPDGKILGAGHTVIPGRSFDFALVRYNPDGTLDNSFGWAGRIAIDMFGGPDGLHGLALFPDGKAVVAGDTLNPATGGDDFIVARFLMSDPDWIAGVVSQLAPSVFALAGQQAAIVQELDVIEAQITAGLADSALAGLNSLTSRMDGCGTAADGTDWIVDCAAQQRVRGLIDQLIGKLP